MLFRVYFAGQSVTDPSELSNSDRQGSLYLQDWTPISDLHIAPFCEGSISGDVLRS